MTVAERILRCKVVEQIRENPEYAKKLGIKDVSKYYIENKGNNENKK